MVSCLVRVTAGRNIELSRFARLSRVQQCQKSGHGHVWNPTAPLRKFSQSSGHSARRRCPGTMLPGLALRTRTMISQRPVRQRGPSTMLAGRPYHVCAHSSTAQRNVSTLVDIVFFEEVPRGIAVSISNRRVSTSDECIFFEEASGGNPTFDFSGSFL